MSPVSQKLLLVGGLGHTDLSGKVPRPGLILLRQALERAGHEAEVVNYATRLAPRIFPPALVTRLKNAYTRSIRPVVIDGLNPLKRPWKLWQLRRDMARLKRETELIFANERIAFKAAGADLAHRVAMEKFDAVGFSLYLGAATSGAIVMAEILRQSHPELPIFFGGPQTTHFAAALLRAAPSVTALVQGEGELSIVELAKSLPVLKNGSCKPLSKIPNLVYRDTDGQVKFTKRQRMPLNQWIETSAISYREKDFSKLMRYAFIETSRGCIFGCRFCPQPLLSGKDRYLKPAAKVVDEMLRLEKECGVCHFEFVGSSTPFSQAEEIADELLARGLENRFKWGLFMRGKDERPVSDLPAVMEKLKKSGACAIFFGVEAADNQTLAQMGKGETIEEIKTTMLAARKAGLAVIGSFIYPYPGMPEQEAEHILDFLKEVKPLSAPTQPLGLYPGTYCAEHATEIGMQILYPDPRDQRAAETGAKPTASMQSPEVLDYLLQYPLILSLPARFWPPLPWKINGFDYARTTSMVNALQKKMGRLGILSGLSHSHLLMAETLNMSPPTFAERLFYCSLTGDPEITAEIIDQFNQRAAAP